MRKLLIVLACLGLASCDADTLGYVDKAKYDALQRQFEKVEGDLKAAQQQVSDCQAHKYQVYKEGYRTWRLDTVTGATCLLLTTEVDWKNAKTASEACY